MKISCQDTLVPGVKFEQKYQTLKDWGFDGVELSGDLLMENFKEIKSALDSTGLQASTICSGFRGWLVADETEDRKLAVKDIKCLLEYAAELGAVGLITPSIYGTSDYLPFPTRKRTKEEDKKILIEALQEIGEYAEKLGVLLLLEPLLRYQTHLVNSLADGLEIIEAVGSRGVKLMADFFHMQMEEKEIDASLIKAKEQLAHIHLSDSNRLLPGQGHTDFKGSLAVLKAVGYNNYLAFEAIPPGNPQEVADALAYIRLVLQD